MAAFIQVVAQYRDTIDQYWTTWLVDCRNQLQIADHKRAASIAVELLLAWREIGHAVAEYDPSLDLDQFEELGHEYIVAALDDQNRHQEDADPAKRFIRLLQAALASKRAYIEHIIEPAKVGSGPMMRPQPPINLGIWDTHTPRIGWFDGQHVLLDPRDSKNHRHHRHGFDGQHVLLDPEVAYTAAQQMARDQGSALTVSPRTLRKRLHQGGWLAETPTNRSTLTVRRVIDKVRREVLWSSYGLV